MGIYTNFIVYFLLLLIEKRACVEVGYAESESCCFCWIQLSRCQACHGSDSLLLDCHLGGLGSILGQSMWDLCWIKWHWHRFFCEYFGFGFSLSFYRCSIVIHSSVTNGL